MAGNKGWSNDEYNGPNKALPTVGRDINAVRASMKLLTEETKSIKFKGAIFGNPGTGKTISSLRLAHALVDGTDKPLILYIDTAMNWVSALNHPELIENVVRLPYVNWDDNISVARWVHAAKEVPFHKVGAIIYDEYNSMIADDLAWITQQRSIASINDDKKYRDPYFPQRPDYLAVMHRSNILLSGLNKLDCHLIFVSHAAVDKETYWIEPDMPGATKKNFMRQLHVVAYAYLDSKAQGENRYKFRLSPLDSQKIAAKGRIGRLGDIATMPQIMEAYHKWGIQPDESETGEDALIGEIEKPKPENMEARAPLTDEFSEAADPLFADI